MSKSNTSLLLLASSAMDVQEQMPKRVKNQEVAELGIALQKAETTADYDRMLDILNALGKLEMTVDILVQVKIGFVVQKFRKHTNATVAKVAESLVKKWREFAIRQGAVVPHTPAKTNVQVAKPTATARPAATVNGAKDPPEKQKEKHVSPVEKTRQKKQHPRAELGGKESNALTAVKQPGSKKQTRGEDALMSMNDADKPVKTPEQKPKAVHTPIPVPPRVKIVTQTPLANKEVNLKPLNVPDTIEEYDSSVAPTAPRHYLSIFYDDHREQVSQENVELADLEINQLMDQMWMKLPAVEKLDYKYRALEEEARCMDEMERFKAYRKAWRKHRKGLVVPKKKAASGKAK